MKKIREVVRLRFGREATIGQIAAACKMGRSTAHEYVERAEAAGLGWPLPEGASDKDLQELLFPKQEAGSRPLPDWNEVRRQLGRKGVTLALLWQEYTERHPDGYGYTRFTTLFKEWLGRSDLRMLQIHKAGEKLFVDWAGPKMEVVDAQTGEVRQASVFVGAMGASQMIFARACLSEDSRNWLDCHMGAFDFYGALPEVLVPDNLKTGVHDPSYYEPELNPAYAEFARFYEIAVLPARVRKPRDKAKVENAVQQVERWVLAPLRDRRFFSLEELNEAIEQLEELNGRLMKGPQASRRELFEQEDLPAMRPVPGARFVYAQWKTMKLGPDYHVEFEGHRYSAPYKLVGKPLDVRATSGVVEIFHSGTRVASHARSFLRRGATTDPSHMPEGHVKAPWNPERFLRWAEKIGEGAVLFVSTALERPVHSELAHRMLLGVLKLEKGCGKERLNAACGRACTLGDFSYSGVKTMLDKRLENAPVLQPLKPLPEHGNVRGRLYYSREVSCDN